MVVQSCAECASISIDLFLFNNLCLDSSYFVCHQIAIDTNFFLFVFVTNLTSSPHISKSRASIIFFFLAKWLLAMREKKKTRRRKKSRDNLKKKDTLGDKMPISVVKANTAHICAERGKESAFFYDTLLCFIIKYSNSMLSPSHAVTTIESETWQKKEIYVYIYITNGAVSSIK